MGFFRHSICDIKTLMTNGISHYDDVCCILWFLVLFSRSLWWRRGLAVSCCSIHGDTECSSATIIFITSTTGWPQVKQQRGNTAPPTNRKLDSRFTEQGATHQNKTQLPLSQFSHLEASISLLSIPI